MIRVAIGLRRTGDGFRPNLSDHGRAFGGGLTRVAPDGRCDDPERPLVNAGRYAARIWDLAILLTAPLLRNPIGVF